MSGVNTNQSTQRFTSPASSTSWTCCTATNTAEARGTATWGAAVITDGEWLLWVKRCCLMQVSCNDWHLESELSSAYLLEKLVYSMQEAQVEAGPPEDGADSWVATPYATLQPCTIGGSDDARLKGTWQRPWADEMEVIQYACCRVIRSAVHDACHIAWYLQKQLGCCEDVACKFHASPEDIPLHIYIGVDIFLTNIVCTAVEAKYCPTTAVRSMPAWEMSTLM